MLIRYQPESKPLPSAPYPVSAILPRALASRRHNRGFEGLACNRRAARRGSGPLLCWAFLQSPMARESYLYRVVELDLSQPLAARVTGMFVA